MCHFPHSYAQLTAMLKDVLNDTSIETLESLVGAFLEYLDRELEALARVDKVNLGGFLRDSSRVLAVFSTALVNITEEAGWLLEAPIVNPRELLKMLRSGDVFEYLCMTSEEELGRIYKVPENVNLTTFYMAVCNTSLDSELLNAQGLDELLRELSMIIKGDVIKAANLSVMIQNSERIAELIMELQKNPPTFLEEQLSALQDVFEQLFMSGELPDPQVLDTIVPLLKDILKMVGAEEYNDMLDAYTEGYKVYAEFANELLGSLQMGNGTLKLKHLLRNSTEVRRQLLQRTTISNRTITRYLDMGVHPSKVSLFIIMLGGYICFGCYERTGRLIK